MQNRPKLTRSAPDLLESFRDAHYHAGFLLLDRDRTPCVTAVLNEFDPSIQHEASKPIADRYLFICIAVRGLEAWFLADQSAIAAVLPQSKWSAPTETGVLDAGTTIKGLWQQQYGKKVAFNKRNFAERIAAKFAPDEASQHYESFRLFWQRIKLRVTSAARHKAT
jgi:hypothetical protein